jgi:hypothetical protein
MKTFIAPVMAIASLLTAGYANAYTTYGCGSGNAKWSGTSKTIYANRASFPVGSGLESALYDAIARLNENASNFTYNLVIDSYPPSLNNGYSEIWIENISPPGVTSLSWNGSCNLTEIDIRMDSSVTWTTSTSKATQTNYGGTGRPFQTTLLHELGHGIGLGHEADEYNVMGQDWDHVSTNGETAYAYFGEDANDGAVFLYGSDGTQDVGVVHWRYTGASGEYSSHDRTRLLDPSTLAELPYSWVNGEKRYNVNRGQSVRVELTFENNGNDYQYEDTGYYVSTNSTISTIDTLLATRSIGLSPDNVLTSSWNVTIPSNLSCSTEYWVGAVIDKDYSLTEYMSWNNATYIPLYINFDFSCLVIFPGDITL